MFELPEFVTLASQINGTLLGKTVASGALGNKPHKFVWYNRSPEEFARLVAGKRIGPAHARGKWLFVPLEPGHVLLFGECGGRMLYYDAILATVGEVIELGGRYDEIDLYGNPGGYVRRMDKEAAGRPCPECGTTVQKIQYLGGACYFCPACQT